MANNAATVPPRVAAALSGAARPVCAYVYDTAALRQRARTLRSALPQATLFYAIKANGHPAVVSTLAAELDGVEVASGGELDLALRYAGAASTVAFSGPAKTDAELRTAVAAGAIVHVESRLELQRLATAGGGQAVIRVNRSGEGLPGTHRMTGEPTQFGVGEADLDALFAEAPATVRVTGFHLHAVSNNLDAAAHARFVLEAAGWAVRAAQRYGVDLAYLNVGGGLGVDYTGGAAFDLSALAGGVRRARAVLPATALLALEPGRWLAASAGWYAAEVVDLKRTQGRWYAVLRGGTHHFRLPAAWGYSHPFTVLPVDTWQYGYARPQVHDVPVDVAGELCTPRDILARDALVSRLRVGDVLVFGNAGAYGWDISHHDFLRHPYPQVLVI